MLEEYRNRTIRPARGGPSRGTVQICDQRRGVGYVERDHDGLVCSFELADAYVGIAASDRVTFKAVFTGTKTALASSFGRPSCGWRIKEITGRQRSPTGRFAAVFLRFRRDGVRAVRSPP